MAIGDGLPLHQPLYSWSKFRLDALGLVTLLGAEEVSRAIGGLQHSWLTEYLPLMGAFMVAGNRFTEPLPGYKAYNITDGINPPELSGAFTRWLDIHLGQSCRREATTTILHWDLVDEREKRTPWTRQLVAILIGVFLNSALLTITILVGDWYGIANAAAMSTSVIVRWGLIRQNRLELRKLVKKSREKREGGKPQHLNMVKMLVEPPNSNRIVVNHIQGALVACFLTQLDKPHEPLYRMFRFVGWAAFGIHVISIGQSTLTAQLLTVTIMTCATVAAIYRWGCTEGDFGHLLKVQTIDFERQPRMECYVDLQPTEDEERALKTWFLMPLSTNKGWYENYNKLKDLGKSEYSRTSHVSVTKSHTV